jgi:hypothetical protein
MPRSNTVLQVFVASPGDVAEERRILESVITETNKIWSSNLNITFELVKWETDVYPSFSSDPQAVINEQIGEEYDVFIGIFWGRLGTATPRASSGSIEEFERALSRNKISDGQYPKVMVYFKDSPISPSKIDSIQIQKIQEFKESLSDMGGLYFVFEDSAGFEASLRAHLTAIAQKFIAEKDKSYAIQGASESQLSNSDVEPDDDDDYGYFDYIEIYETKTGQLTAAMDVITTATKRMGEQVLIRNQEARAASGGSTNVATRIFKRTADDLNSFAETVAAQVPIFSAARVASFDALTNALAIHGDFKDNGEQLQPLRETLLEMNSQAIHARISMSEMGESTNGLPRLTKELNKAKRQVVQQIDALVLEIDSVISTITNIIKSIDRLLGT